jgi:hypothetical protein
MFELDIIFAHDVAKAVSMWSSAAMLVGVAIIAIWPRKSNCHTDDETGFASLSPEALAQHRFK